MEPKTRERRASVATAAVWMGVFAPLQVMRTLGILWPQGDSSVGRELELRTGPIATPFEGLCPWGREELETIHPPAWRDNKEVCLFQSRLWQEIKKSQSWSFLALTYPHMRSGSSVFHFYDLQIFKLRN